MLIQNLLDNNQIKKIANLNYIDYKNKVRFTKKSIHQKLSYLQVLSFESTEDFVVFGTLMYNPEFKYIDKMLSVTQFLEYLNNKLKSFMNEQSYCYFICCIELHKGYKSFIININYIVILVNLIVISK